MGLAGTLRFIVQHPLNQGGRARALGRFLRWQLATRLSPRPVAFPFVEEMRFLAEPGMTGASGNFYCGLHEAEDMAFVLHLLRPGDVFYDIGANVGSYTLLATAAGARAHAFEPSPGTAAKLCRNVELNGLGARVRVHEIALGARPGVVEFTRGSDTMNHVVAKGEKAGAVDRVRVEPLDSVFEEGTPAFLKIDVEGFEAEVLAGAVSALSSPDLMGLLVEDNASGRDVVQQLLGSGFRIFRYDPVTRRLREGAPGQGTANLLFLRDPAVAGERVASARRFKLVNGWI